MPSTFPVLLASAASLGVLHTALGIDHSLPFVVLAKTRSWSLRKTWLVTSVCGVLHVLSSVLIAGLGLGLGVAVGRLSWIESARGNVAAWLLVGFGLAYATIAFWKTRAQKAELRGHGHSHPDAWQKLSERAERISLPAQHLMPALFVIFALGPCEALLPLLTASGIALTWTHATLVAVLFSCATVLTMLGLVTLGYMGLSVAERKIKWLIQLEPHAHALAGLSLALSGLTIQWLGI